MKIATPIIALTMSIVATNTTNAQSSQYEPQQSPYGLVYDYKQNPWGLVYENAITENVKGKVNIHPVTYKLNGIDIAANVYTPAGYDWTKKYPAITIAHPNGGVKEQTAGLYAQRSVWYWLFYP